MLIVIVWRLSSNGKFLGKNLFKDFKINLSGTAFTLVEFLFEMIGFFVVMIVLGEMLRRAFRSFVEQVAAQKKAEKERLADQEALNVSILLTLCFLVYTIS